MRRDTIGRLSLAAFLLLGICGLLAVAQADGTDDPLAAAFRQPGTDARPWVYWFWMNGNITPEGITADLEAMHEVGIGGCLIMHVKLGDIGEHKLGNMPPDGPVRFMSDDFRKLFTHAAREAQRLGMTLDMNNADGFTGSGGPWVPVEKAMKKLVWTQTRVSGGEDVSVALPQPETILDFYRDTAVIAFPCQPSLKEQMEAAGPSFDAADEKFAAPRLTDGDRQTWTPIWREGLEGKPQVTVSFPQPFTADTLVLENVRVRRGAPLATLEVSDDGKDFHSLGRISLKWYPAAPTNTVRFDACTARHFRISFWPNAKVVTVGEMALGRSNMVHYWEPKAGFTRYGEWGGGSEFYTDRKTTPLATDAKSSPTSPHAPPAIPSSQVLDLSDSMNDDGRLSWQAPQGDWTVLRIGYTSTGIKNHPASEGGHGLECDKLHPSGVEAAFDGMLKKLIDDSGDLVGRSFAYAHIDSWEVGIQNWTEGMAEVFKERNGYDLAPFYPLLVAGHAVRSNDASERFLWDLRQTLLTMMAENYLGRVQSLCHENGLKFSSEAGGRQTFLHNPMYLLAGSDLPMGEFWPHEGTPRVDGKAAASVAHLYDKPLVGAEAFTGAGGFASWKSHPYTLKGIGDEAFCLGINHLVIHYYVHQAYEGFQPGFAMGPWGIHLDRMNTWWKQGRPWFNYLARCQYLLRQGQFVADVLYFPGEGAPQHLGKRESLSVPLPAGYDFDACDRETLLNRLAVKDGRLVLPSGISYRYLMLSADRTMTPRLARKIRELVDAGATVIGPQPISSPSLQGFPACDEDLRQTAHAIWPGGRVLWGKTFDAIASGDVLTADFEFDAASEEADIRYIHRRTQQADVYFVANRNSQAVEGDAVFRIAGKQPELWHPESGAIRDLPDWRQTDDGRTSIPLRFEPLESFFIVFGDEDSPPSSAGENFPKSKTVAAISGPWTVEFPPGQGTPASLQFDEPASWTEHEDFSVRHFSGTATYRKTFSRPKGIAGGGSPRPIYLDLGQVEVIAEVKLNNRDLGTLWKPPFRLEVTHALKSGDNLLEIRVTNLWTNRLIGDEYFPDDAQWVSGMGAIYLNAWPEWFLSGKPRPEPRRKTFSVVKHYDKTTPLLPSGLLGPVLLRQ